MRSPREIIEAVKNDEGHARLWAVIGGVAAVIALPVAICMPFLVPGGVVNTAPSAFGTTAFSPAPVETVAVSEEPSPSEEPPESPTPQPSVEESPTESPIPSGPISLASLDPVRGHADTQPAALGGVTYLDLVRLDPFKCNKQRVDYNLGKRYSRFTAKVGLYDDYSSTDVNWIMAVYSVEGNTERPLFKKIMKFGDISRIDVSVKGVLRLRLSVEWIDPGRLITCSPYNSYDGVWAEPTLIP
ncbi:hypothetical protein Cs7R123_07740 [Catellatospora sp. TT07R-123]|uniref:NPCBM/NEW2 domain-containing protein n=1 Tax=Catellatospora sp. TT07R-123 TaxID=2733863 RepID=UPI001B2BE375|nr:NPCBM/NEW2 domain-containing protein [Catellatospora sp. TT07R-123]GHJ43432.1 hypothetical protein Cs7R123_07740 [Catellatospora sp. TT07R-123]